MKSKLHKLPVKNLYAVRKKQLKRISHFLLFFLLASSVSQAQSGGGNPFDYISIDSMEHSTDPGGYFIRTLRQHINPAATKEGGKHKAATRALAYWMDRLPLNTPAPFKKYAQALSHQPAATCPIPVGTFNGSWDNIGPEMSTVSQGNVWAIYVPDGQSQEMFIGFEAGGLWRTTDGGQNWVCISDGFLSNGTVGITDIVVDPNNANNLSLSTALGGFEARNFTSWHYGQGIWHSTDAGLTWQQDASYSPMGLMRDLAYSHDQIGASNDKMLWGYNDSQTDAVFSKIGTAPFTNITTILESLGFPDTTEVVDIDFAEDIPGRAYISTKTAWRWYAVQDTAYAHHTVGIWQVDYDLTTGLPTNVDTIFSVMNTVPYTSTYNDTVYDLRTTYIGNGELYSVMHDGGWTFGQGVVMHYDGSNWQVVEDNLNGGNIAFMTHSMMSIESSKEDPNTIYLGLTLPIKLSKTGSTWNPREVFHNYGATANTDWHVDIRRIFLQKNGTAADQVYWGHDGGINQGTSTNTYTNVPTRNVYTTLSYELDISNLGDKKAIATLHNGLINTRDGFVTPWEASIPGDMYGVFYDHRTNNNNQEIMTSRDGNWINRNHSNTDIQAASFPPYRSPFKGQDPVTGWKEHHRTYQYPQDFNLDSNLMYVANKNLWRTPVFPIWFSDWEEDTDNGDLLNDFPTIKDIARATRIAPSNTGTKYLLQRRDRQKNSSMAHYMILVHKTN